MSHTPSPFPYTIPQTGEPITNQEDLIMELTIALGLIETGETTEQQNKGAQIMLELTNRPIEEPANRIDAMREGKKNIKSTDDSSEA